jgi:protein-disulfide isomerase
MKTGLAFGSVVCLLALVAVAGGWRRKSLDGGGDLTAAAATPAIDDSWEHTKTVFRVPVGESPVLGSPNALVTIVEFADFPCAPCRSMEPVLSALRAKYGDAIRLVWKNDPPSFRVSAEPAAEAALEVRAEKGDEGFWKVHDGFFDHEQDLTRGGAPNIDAIVKIAGEAGAAPDKVREAIAQRAHQKEIEADLDLGEDLDNKGTLHFFINGRRLEGAQRQANFERMIDEERHRAQGVLAQAVPPNELYEVLTKDGRGPWAPELKDVPKDLPANDPALGSPKASVTIHVWSDYQCALCVAVERTMAELRKDYGDRIRFVWHDLPLPRHPDANMVAQAGREAYEQSGTRGFWAMHDKVVNHPLRVTRDQLDTFAREQKLDMRRWRISLDGTNHASEIAADERAAAYDGISETPAYLVVARTSSRGYFVNATQEASMLRRSIERALDEVGE